MPKHLPFALVLLSTPAFAANPPYIFTPLADSTGPFATFSNAAINNQGLVAFRATLDNQSQGIYVVSTSLAPTPISLKGDPIPSNGTITSFGTDFDINDSGIVAFEATTSTSASTLDLRSTSTPLVLISNQFSSGPALNNSGVASFVAGVHSSIITSDGASSTTVATATPGFLIVDGSGTTSINNHGAVAFVGATSSAGATLFSTAPGSLTALVDGTGPYKLFVGAAQNSSGTIATIANHYDSSESIITVTPAGAVSTLVSSTAGNFKSFTGVPSINDAGTVLFLAVDPNNHVGLYTGPDPIADKVIDSGDPLFGSTISQLLVLDNGLNNSGQIAFRANLANGINYILLASPASPGDANADGHVDLTDLSTILNNFGATTPLWSNGNFDNQPTIDLTDLSDVLNNFGQTNPSAFSLQPSAFSNTPEPTTLSLALATTTLFITRRNAPRATRR